jgi:hypothetical protein
MYVKDYRDVPSEPGGADRLTVRWVINASQGEWNKMEELTQISGNYDG